VLAQIISFPIKHHVDVGEALGLFSALQWITVQFDSANFVVDLNVTVDIFSFNRHEVMEFGQVTKIHQNLF